MAKKEIAKIYSEIGAKIRKLRESKSISQMDLAYRSNLSLSALSNIERAVKKVNIDSLERIAKALNVNMVVFFK
jgi:transcriptional regulator with XRE-family HTH domain